MRTYVRHILHLHKPTYAVTYVITHDTHTHEHARQERERLGRTGDQTQGLVRIQEWKEREGNTHEHHDPPSDFLHARKYLVTYHSPAYHTLPIGWVNHLVTTPLVLLHYVTKPPYNTHHL